MLNHDTGMRSRSSLNGTARNRDSRSARPSSSAIVSTWSLDIWRPAPSISAPARYVVSIASSGLAFTHLRPNLFMQGLLAFRSSIASQGRLFAPAGDAPVSIVDVRDIAAVAAAALTQNGHENKTYDITGPEALTHNAIASVLTTVLEKAVTHVDVPEAAMRESLCLLDLPEWQAEGLIEDYAHYRRGEASAVSSAVQDVTGRPPQSFREFAEDYKDAFLL